MSHTSYGSCFVDQRDGCRTKVNVVIICRNTDINTQETAALKHACHLPEDCILFWTCENGEVVILSCHFASQSQLAILVVCTDIIDLIWFDDNNGNCKCMSDHTVVTVMNVVVRNLTSYRWKCWRWCW